MFIVSRKSEESVIVDGFNNPLRELKVTVLEIKGGRVKLAFEVNTDSPIHRSQRSELDYGAVASGWASEGSEVLDA